MNGLLKPSFSGDAFRFLVAGLVNTGLTLLVYQLLLFTIAPSLAYAGSWIVGLAFVAGVYPNKVFTAGRRTMRDRLLVAGSYCGVFLTGLAILHVLQAASMSPRLAIVFVIAATTALNFILSRKILRR